MGLKAAGKTDLPSKKVNWMNEVRKCKFPVPFDTANLMFAAAWLNAKSCYHGDYQAAILMLQRYFRFYQRGGLSLLYVLDGKHDPMKESENIRRRKSRALASQIIEEAIDLGGIADIEVYRRCVVNSPRYILLVSKLLEFMKLPFIVGEKEADAQLAWASLEGIAISFDSDLLAHGVLDKIRVTAGGWTSGRALRTSVRSLVGQAPESEGNDGLSAVFRKHGKSGLVYFGALTGTDYSPLSCGIPGIGHKKACAILLSLGAPLSVKKVSSNIVHAHLLSLAKPFQRDIADHGPCVIEQNMEPVIYAFGSATYYDADCNVRSIAHPDIILEYSSLVSIAHSKGVSDPRTGEPLTPEDDALLEHFDMARLGREAVHFDKAFVESCRIPDNYKNFNVSELRAIVAARGGTVTHVKNELLAYVGAMKELEADYDPIVIDVKSGFFLSSMSVKGNMVPLTEVTKLLGESEVQRSPKFKSLLETTKRMYTENKVLEDMDEIALNSAVMTTNFISFLYADVGQPTQSSKSRKVMRDSFSKSKEQISSRSAAKRYHGYAVISPTEHLLITTQSASLQKDESTRSKKQKGEKPDPKMYLVIMLISVVPSSQDDDSGHIFGNASHVVAMWCGCKAGQKECIHCGMASIDQIRLWAPNYTGSDICTQGDNQWQHRGAARLKSYTVMHPVHCHGFEKIVDNRTNYQYRSVREEKKASASLHFSVLSDADFKLVHASVNKTTLEPLFDLLKEKHANNRSCRAALTYQDGATDDGLEDVRSNVELWGTKQQKKDHKEAQLNTTS